MKQVYQYELPHFLEALDVHCDDIRFALPQEMIDAIERVVKQ